MSIKNLDLSSNKKLNKAVERISEISTSSQYSETVHNESYCVIVD